MAWLEIRDCSSFSQARDPIFASHPSSPEADPMTHALVTGGSRGIGRAVSLALGRTGTSVTVNYRSNGDAAAAVVAELEALGVRGAAVQADVSLRSAVPRLFDEAEAQLGRVDVLVVNAGAPGFGTIAEASDEDFDATFAAITAATFAVLREGARRLADGGRIVIVSSGAAVTPGPGGGLYGAAKGAIDFWGATLAKELGPRGITVNSVMPGLTDTDGLILPREQIDAMVAQTPLGRLGQPADVADVVAFFASDAGRWVTGQRIGAAGGLV
jgi:3-oxoacyl-[acyl-carrier protein] reductase